jgi:hypothetical protein
MVPVQIPTLSTLKQEGCRSHHRIAIGEASDSEAARIQKVNDKIEVNKPAPQTVDNNQ